MEVALFAVGDDEMVTKREVIEIVRRHIDAHFPRVCSCCGRPFSDFVEFVRVMRSVGDPVSGDAELGDFKPIDPIGTYALANCPCGTTLCLSSEGMERATMWRLLHYARAETERRKISCRQLLREIRQTIVAQVQRRGAA